MRKLQNIAIFGMIAAILSVSLAAAAPTTAEVEAGTAESYSWTPSTNTTTIQGGEVKQVNVSVTQVTDKWVGFWGEVSGSMVLADASGHYFYQWTIDNPTGSVVYACNDTVSNWNTLAALYADSGYLPEHLLTGHDAFNFTFTQQEDFTRPNEQTIPAVNYTVTNPTDSNFKTYALYADSGKVLVWAGLVNADQTSFKGGSITADYQILAGVDQTGASETFYFYLELK